MSKGTVSAAMGMLQMLIFTVGIEISKHAWLNGGNGLFNLFNLVNGILWLSLMVIFLKDKQMGKFSRRVKKMPDCFVRSGILELMVMVVNLVFDNHPFTYAGKMANIRMRAVSRSWRRSHIDGLRHSRDADRLWNAD